MPFFLRELNELADRIGRSDLTVYLHTSAPTEADPTNGRVTTGGGTYASGATVATADIDMASNGDIMVTAAVDFGTAAAAVGTVTYCSVYRGADAVGYYTLPSTVIANGDGFAINANTIQFNGSST